MKKLPLINQNDEKHALEKLNRYYADKMIPAEKKAYLSKHQESCGPYLAVESNGPEGANTHYMLDAASQIATLGLGFNSSVFMGTTQFLESWINDANGEDFRSVVKAYERFLQRKLGWESVHLNFCHSGAEANEMALGHAYRKRKNPNAKKVMCFEGSFHGRMLVSLFASWNKSKREPFEWPGFEACYLPFPEMPHINNGLNLIFPKKWTETWDNATSKNFSIPKEWSRDLAEDELLQSEIQSLLQVREKLLAGDIFASIIEPMQCEGGDRYASNRFHSALILICRSFQVPVIHDEVQTGFHLGREFFWHKQLELVGLKKKNLRKGDRADQVQLDKRETLAPDYVTCAKKAQIGLVISPTKQVTNKLHEAEFQVASVIRGYLHALGLDQSAPKIEQLESRAKEKLDDLIKKHQDLIERPRVNGIAFAFDLKDATKINEIINLRFEHGLLYYPAGSKTLRFRLNTAFSDRDIDFLFIQIDKILQRVFRGEKVTPPQEVETIERHLEETTEWQQKILSQKFQRWEDNGQQSFAKSFEDISEFFASKLDLELVQITAENFEQYRELISDLQKRNYEPARQTSIETFERTAKSSKGLCLGVKKGSDLTGIIFSAPLSVNPLDRGVREDPFYGNDDVLYMVDTTIDKSMQGRGLGRNLKYALTLLAQAQGRLRLQGRNRDRLASQMFKINLSLGGYEQNFIRDDYQDFEKYRDVHYYTCPLYWHEPPVNLSSDLRSTLSARDLSFEFIKEHFATLTNKICLSNFVSEAYLKSLKTAFDLLHPSLRHGYSASGQSEAIDKVAKAIWYSKTQGDKALMAKTSHKMLTFENHYFGQGSFLSRSLSFAGSDEEYFPVIQLNDPNKKNAKEIQAILDQLETHCKSGEILAVWLEPIRQLDMQKTDKDFLVAVKNTCTKYNIPLVYNETASTFYRYSDKAFVPNNEEDLTPDAGLIYTGGQSALAYMHENYFVENPLMMISTWDGDEFSMATFIETAKKFTQAERKKEYLKVRSQFEEKLTNILDQYSTIEYQIQNGVGAFWGPAPRKLTALFEKIGDVYRVVPHYSDMVRFLEQYDEYL